jgi:hypothetical protein
VFTLKFGKRRLEDSKPAKNCIIERAIGQGLVSAGSRTVQDRLFLRMTSSNYTASEEDMSDSTEREELESKLS